MARDYTVSLVSGKKMTIPGVASEEYEDAELYDGDTYRNVVTAADLGRPVAGFMSHVRDEVVAGGVNYSISPHGNPHLNSRVLTEQGSSAPPTPTISDITDGKWIDDRVDETDPHPLKKTRGRYKWKDGSNAVIGWAWADEIDCVTSHDAVPGALATVSWI